MKKKIGDRIRKIRESKDFTQENMADELGITFGAYSKIERGETDPNTSRLEQIAAILKVNVTDFFEYRSPSVQVAEDIKQYGFAAKEEVESLTKLVQSLAREIEKMRQELSHLSIRKARKVK